MSSRHFNGLMGGLLLLAGLSMAGVFFLRTSWAVPSVKMVILCGIVFFFNCSIRWASTRRDEARDRERGYVRIPRSIYQFWREWATALVVFLTLAYLALNEKSFSPQSCGLIAVLDLVLLVLLGVLLGRLEERALRHASPSNTEGSRQTSQL